MEIQIKPQGLAEAISRVNGTRKRAPQLWARSATTIGGRAVELIQRYYRGASATEPDRTAVRSGALRRAYTHAVTRKNATIDLQIGVIRPGDRGKVLRYAATHEYGATITPKRAKSLTIPLDAAKTRSGVTRGRARDYPNTFIRGDIIYQKTDAIVQAEATGKKTRSKPRALFLLRRSVTIKARPALEPIRRPMTDVLEERITADFREALTTAA